MSTQRSSDQIIHAFFQDGVDELPDRSFDAVRTAIDQTRQWAVVGPWKEPQIMTATRFALIAAAIAVLAVVAIRFLPSTNIGPAPTPSPSPAPSPAPRTLPASGPIQPGAYYVSDPANLGVQRLTFDVPAGWTKADFIAKDSGSLNEVMFTEWVVKYVYPDACKWDNANVITTTTSADLVNAIAAQKNRTSSAVTSTTIDGFPAQEVTLTVSPTLDASTCTNGNLRYWPGVNESGPDFGSGMCCNLAGNIDTVYVVDVNGKRIVLVARHYPGSSAQSLAELQSVVDSVRIEP